MKKLLLLLLLLPGFSYAQETIGSIRRNNSSGINMGVFGTTRDTLVKIQINSLANLDMLRYNSATGKFIPRTPAQVATDIGAITSLSATSPIFYNSGTGVISSQAAGAAAAGYVTTGAQTFAGNKKFTAAMTLDNGAELTLNNFGNTQSVGIQAAAVASSYIALLPSKTGTQTFAMVGDTTAAFANLVHKNGAETINGTKTFTGNIFSSAVTAIKVNGSGQHQFIFDPGVGGQTFIGQEGGSGGQLVSGSLAYEGLAGTYTNTTFGIVQNSVIRTTWLGGLLTHTGSMDVSSTVTAPTFVGALTGHASLDLALTGGTLTGDLSISKTTPNINLTSTSGTGFGSITWKRNTSTDIGYLFSGVNTGVSGAGDYIALSNPLTTGGIVFKTNNNTLAVTVDNAQNVAIVGNVTAANLVSGTYTPTITGIGNVASSSTQKNQYTRIGNIVTVFGSIIVTPTTASTGTVVAVSLPIASNLASSQDLNGTGAWGRAGVLKAPYIFGDIAGDTAYINYTPPDNSIATIYYSFSYEVL